MMTEYGYVEKPILEWLAGKPTDPADRGLGWTFRTEAEMAEFNRPLADPLVEGLLLPAPRSVRTCANPIRCTPCGAGLARPGRSANGRAVTSAEPATRPPGFRPRM